MCVNNMYCVYFHLAIPSFSLCIVHASSSLLRVDPGKVCPHSHTVHACTPHCPTINSYSYHSPHTHTHYTSSLTVYTGQFVGLVALCKLASTSKIREMVVGTFFKSKHSLDLSYKSLDRRWVESDIRHWPNQQCIWWHLAIKIAPCDNLSRQML